MTGANTSTAVMNSRISPMKALDFFATPPWATRALVEEVLRPEGLLGPAIDGETVLDPCCGAGHMAIPLSESFSAVVATDIHDWGFGEARDRDFTMATRDSIGRRIDWVVCNPPFNLAERFLDRGLAIAETGVAMLLRLNWLEGMERHDLIFSTRHRPHLVCPFAERVAMIEGCWDPEASSATAYGWFLWSAKVGRRSEILHIPPGMAVKHTRASDEALANRGEAARRRLARTAP